ncbi:MAG TPA: sugar ABC transporter substrate-binding protein [Thermomicrobiales bacterium]|nr:sugar ABC transporter substrate-binding protein [Thermomicrobiales bacterium]
MRYGTSTRRGLRASAGLGVIVVAMLLIGVAGVAAQGGTPSPAAQATPTVPDACQTEAPAEEQITVGYAGLSGEFPFVQDVNDGLQRVADCLNVELIIMDNEYDPQVALTNADTLVTRGVDVAIEFQTDVGIAPAICNKFDAADIPVIAIDIPHEPCATFFGADNLEAGRIGGRNLGRAAMERWGGDVDALVLLELPQSGELPQQRMDGAVQGVQEVLPDLTDDKIIRVDGKGNLEDSRTVFTDVLTRLSDADHILVSAINDPSAVGALRAAEAAGRTDDVMIAGQNATIEARTEICRDNPAFIGSVAYFPDRYGDYLIPLAIQIAGGEEPPEEVLIDHLWIDRSNIEQYYPDACSA